MTMLKKTLRSINFPAGIVPIGPVISPDVIGCASTTQDIIRLAHLRAEEIIQQAQNQADQIRRSEQESAFEQSASHIRQSIDDLLSTKQSIEEQVSDFAYQVASKALARLQIVLSTEEKLKASINQLVSEITPAVSMKLHVAHDCVESTELYLQELLAKGVTAVQTVTVMKDQSLAPGDAALVTPTGARLDARLDNILTRLIGVLDTNVSRD